MKARQLLRVSYLLPLNSDWHVWTGQATSKLSAYRQYAKERKAKGMEVEPSEKLILKQYGVVQRLSRGHWVDCYQ